MTKQPYLIRLAVASCITIMFILWQFARANAPQQGDTPYRVEEFAVQSPADLSVRTSGGHITVEGSERNTTRIAMFVRKNGDLVAPGDADLDAYDITIEKDGSTIRAEAKRKNSSSWKFWQNNTTSISFTVYVPSRTNGTLKTSGGHITTSGLQGQQQIHTSGGHLRLENMKGTMDAKTSGGHIALVNITGDVNARTSGGHINAKNTNGDLMLRTSGGRIELEKVAGTISASTSGGSITSEIVRMGDYAEFKTSGGSISLTVPEGTGLNLDLHGTHVRGEISNFSGSRTDDDIEGTIHGGGPRLAARTSGGTVRLSFQ